MRTELEKWEKADCCSNLGMIYEYNCERLFCRTHWNSHSHRGSYHYYVRGSIERKEALP